MYWYWCQCHMMQKCHQWNLPFVMFRWSKWDATQLLAIWAHWNQHQHHEMPITSLMTPLHLYSQDDQNEVQYWHWCWHHIMPIASKLAVLGSRERKWGATWFFHHLVSLALPSMSYHTNSIINGTIAFHMLRKLKWSTTWLLFVM